MNKRDFSFKHSLTTLSVCSLLAFSSTAALAQTGDAPVWRTDLTGGETTTYALSDLAPGMAGKPVKLTGSNNSGYFDFTVKPDEVVTSGELTLNFTVSPSMLANVTQLNIFLNGELQQTAALSAKQIGKPQSLVFNLDSKSFRTGQNQVRVEFVGHYQTVCENASNPSLWMDIAPESELALNKAFVRLPNDLSQFPAPFISEGNSGQNTTLPIVFAQLMVASIAAYGFTRWRGKVRDSLRSNPPTRKPRPQRSSRATPAASLNGARPNFRSISVKFLPRAISSCLPRTSANRHSFRNFPPSKALALNCATFRAASMKRCSSSAAAMTKIWSLPPRFSRPVRR